MSNATTTPGSALGYDPNTDLRTKLRGIEGSARKLAIGISAGTTGLLAMIGASADISLPILAGALICWAPLAYRLGSRVTEFGQGYHALRSGLDGEDLAASILESINPEYRVMRNVLIRNPRSRTGHTEIDLLLVGRKAVYLVEVKNNSGDIIVDRLSAQWMVRGLNGSGYSMRNPARQVSIQQKVFREFMERERMVFPLQAMVAFTSQQAKLHVLNEVAVPLFVGPFKDMSDRIEAYEQKLSRKDDLDIEGLVRRITIEGETSKG